MKRVGYTFTLLAALSALALSCQRESGEQAAPQERTLSIPLLLEDAARTRVDISGTTGKASWTDGDRIGVYIIDNDGINSRYQPLDVDCTAEKVSFSLNAGESSGGYAIYPLSAIYGSDPAPTGDSPLVIFPASYDLTGRTPETFAPAPMVAVNGGETLKFYHAGGLLRLEMANLPEGTARLEVNFPELENVAGVYAVTAPGTAEALTDVNAALIGYGNTITLTGFTYAADLTVNIPIPSGDYSALQSVRIRAYDSGDVLVGAASKTVQRAAPSYNWGVLDHAFGRQLPVDFSAGGTLSHVRLNADTPVTLWKSQSVTRTAKAYYADGRVYTDADFSWESADPGIASVNPTTGSVSAVSPGETVITVRATPRVLGESKTASYTIYVNAVTGFTLAAADAIVDKAGGSTVLTATLTHTDNGTILAYPEDMIEGWTSSETDYITLTFTAFRPTAASATSATATAVATGAEYGGLSTLSALLAHRYAYGISNLTRTCQVRSRTKASCVTTVPTFRGYTPSRGVLEQVNETTWTLTDGTNPFEYLDFRFYGTETSAYPYHYYSWTAMSMFFDGEKGSDITHTLNKIYYAGDTWVLPSGDDWTAIIATDDPDSGALVTNDSGEVSGRKHYAKVTVDLSDSPYSANTSSCKGILLFPDETTVSAAGLTVFDNPTGGFSNQATYQDIMALSDGGCLFLCLNGVRHNSSISYLDNLFLLTNYRTSYLLADNTSFKVGGYFDPDVYNYSARLIRE